MLLSAQSEARSKAAEDPYGEQDLNQSFSLRLLDQNEASLSYRQVANSLQAGVGLVDALIHRPREQNSCLLREKVGHLIEKERWSGP